MLAKHMFHPISASLFFQLLKAKKRLKNNTKIVNPKIKPKPYQALLKALPNTEYGSIKLRATIVLPNNKPNKTEARKYAKI